MKRVIAPLACGLLFGFGLVLSGMTDPRRVIGFLDFAGHWDPTLMFVMGGAILAHAPVVWLLRRRGRTLAGELRLPAERPIDGRLVLGAALFGLGWGLAGYCPGPALVALISMRAAPLLFVAGMLAGSRLAATFDRDAKTSHVPV